MKKYVIIGICCFMFLCLMAFIIPPRIILNGSDTITLEYGNAYEELGAKSRKFWWKAKIKIENNIDINKIGEYKVKYKFKYLFFNVIKERKVTVVDNDKPIITLNGSDIVTVCPKKEYIEEGFNATDGYDGDISDKVSTEDLGDLIKYSVTDSALNETIVFRKIVKKDIEKPIINLKGKDTVYIYVGSNYKESGYDAYDNCDEDITNNVKVSSNLNNKKTGTYEINYSVEDSSGNSYSISRKVKVIMKPDTGSNKSGTIYLTFDDGPSPYTNKLLDILKENNVKATFFVTSTGDGSDEDILRTFNEGHTIGLHSQTHKYSLVYQSTDSYFNDLKLISERVKNITGVESKIIRFPGGSSNTVSKKYSPNIMSTLSNMVLERGYKYFDWNVSSGDGGGVYTKEEVYYNVINNLKLNRMNVVLMHDTNSFSVEAVNDIIKFGKDNGYTFEAITSDTKMIHHSISN